MTTPNLRTEEQIIWCPGCGNFGILAALQNAILQLKLDPSQVVAVFGIGCHGHLANYLKINNFEGLHGRALPLAAGIKIANSKLRVLVMAGDGDQLSEGGNHLVHASRRNPDLTCLIHNNQLYSLTVGQASPTSDPGSKTRSTPRGVLDQALNPLALSLASGASFVARGFAGDIPQLTKILIQAISHPGFALVDILQPCPALNHVNTFAWFKERVYELGPEHDVRDKILAFQKAQEWGEKIPLGVFYRVEREILERQLLPDPEMILTDQSLEKKITNLFSEFQ